MTSSTPWWETSNYALNTVVPADFMDFVGPNGFAILKAWQNGKTQPGWGRDSFMFNYESGEFLFAGTKVSGYAAKRFNLALVMRSVRLICVDIDGKNDGNVGVRQLFLNDFPTTSEISKSGNGYHLFYSVPDTWDAKYGFEAYDDVIGIEKGVDIRGTGCVYHHPQQRWNDVEVSPAPQHLLDRVTEKHRRTALTKQRTAAISTMTTEEKLMLTAELRGELAKPIKAGKRNVTLYALGHQLKEADVDDWEKMIQEKGRQIGLPDEEVDKIIENVLTYAKP